MSDKIDELDKKLFFLSPSERRNAALIGSLFRGGIAVEILGRKPLEAMPNKVKREALSLVMKARGHFNPSISEVVVHNASNAEALEQEGYPNLATVFRTRAFQLAMQHELFELATHVVRDAIRWPDEHAQAMEGLFEVLNLQAAFNHVKQHMREPDAALREASLLPLLNGLLKGQPKAKRAARLHAASRLRILIFLQRYPEALAEANQLVALHDEPLEQEEMIPMLGVALALKLRLGNSIDQDMARLWKLAPLSARIDSMRALQFCLLGWLKFAAYGDLDAGKRAMGIFRMCLPFHRREGGEKEYADMVFWGLHWALLSHAPGDLELIGEAVEPDLRLEAGLFEWSLIVLACHYFIQGEQDLLMRQVRRLRKVKTTFSAGFLVELFRRHNESGLSILQRQRVIRDFAKRADEQPERERNYLDLADFFQVLSSRMATVPRRVMAEGGEYLAAL